MISYGGAHGFPMRPTRDGGFLTVGIKLTHDASVAVLEGWRLITCVELEKLPGGQRYTGMKDLSVVLDVLRAEGYGPSDIETLAIDGWRKTLRRPLLFGQEIEFQVAPYVSEFGGDGSLLSPTCGSIGKLNFESYSHLTDHVLSAYCSSEAARRGVAATVLVWDGAMFPTAVRVDPHTKSLEVLSRLFPLLGDAYHDFARFYWPFDSGYEWPKTLSLAGKLMAYVARGEPSQRLIDTWKRMLAQVPEPPIWHEHYGRSLLEKFVGQCHSVAQGHLEHDALASWHAFLGQVLVDKLQGLRESGRTRGAHDLILAGGCALNIKWNAEIRSRSGFSSVFVPPFPNDSGTAIGAALAARVSRDGFQRFEWNVFAGPKLLAEVGALPPEWQREPADLSKIADLIRSGHIVCSLHGRAELGPRALGHRSLLASPKFPGLKRKLNLLKRREDYRPVSPICLEEAAAEMFEPGCPEPYMLFDHRLRDDWMPVLPNILHEDGTARLQTITASSSPKICALLQALADKGEPAVLCNTSANRAGGGFFHSVAECMRWGSVDYIWSEDELFSRKH